MNVERYIRLPEHLNEQAIKKAKVLDVSVNKYILNLIEKDLSDNEQDKFLAMNEEQIVIEEFKNNIQYTLIELMKNQMFIIQALNKIEPKKETNE